MTLGLLPATACNSPAADETSSSAGPTSADEGPSGQGDSEESTEQADDGDSEGDSGSSGDQDSGDESDDTESAEEDEATSAESSTDQESSAEDSGDDDTEATSASTTDQDSGDGDSAEETSESSSTSGDDTDSTGDDSGDQGCGKTPPHTSGGVQVELDTPGGPRAFYLSLPEDYDPDTPHKLIIGYAGTNWKGAMIQPYLGLESADVDPHSDEIFVYPDPLWRDFDDWGNLGGWLLGPHAEPAHGDDDLEFTSALIEYMQANYCIDASRVFTTGHSWGGDMSMVAACFLGSKIRASVPVAANRPYWFEPNEGEFIDCPDAGAMWVMFGQMDDHFTWQDEPGQFGNECRDYWRNQFGCADDQGEDLMIGQPDECLAFPSCTTELRYCLYDEKYGHQVPGDYFAAQTMAWFRSF